MKVRSRNGSPHSRESDRSGAFSSRARVLIGLGAFMVSAAFGTARDGEPAAIPERATIETAMRRATEFMVDTVSCEGGYVWTYLPDLSRRWGELEARPSMIWIQPPGTVSMGEVFLDAFEATGDSYYYEAAAGVARALIRAQHPSGGWNYCADFAGEASLRDWYATVGRNAWRLEEFHHYYGNATFDDRVTAVAARFLLRIQGVKRDPVFRAALERAIQFVLDAQYANGAWPQRFPLMSGYSKDGYPDYTGYYTFNDDVAAENIDLLERCATELNAPHLREAARRGMDAFLLAQMPQPQPGWALQYTPDFQPAGARTYEPRALATHATAESIEQLFRFFETTRDPRYLARIPEALDWLDAVALPTTLRTQMGRTHPTFVELGTGKPLFIHRAGSNATNGRYYVDYDPARTVVHYASARQIDVAGLRMRLTALQSGTASEDTRNPARDQPSGTIEQVLKELNAEGYWPAPLLRTSHPYRGDGPREVTPGEFSGTQVGDRWDTSPFPEETPVLGISTRHYVDMMRTLIRHLQDVR